MPETQTTAELALMDSDRITSRLIREAMAEWDKVGSGCFAMWVDVIVTQKWVDLVKSN